MFPLRIIPTVTAGDLIVAGVFVLSVGGSSVKIYLKLRDLLAVIREFPPHRHVGDRILYPQGMKPQAENQVGP